MTRRQSATAGDAVGLERACRILERCDAGQMRAVGAAARNDAGMSVEDQRRVEILHRGRERLDAIGQRAVVVMRQAQQHGCDIGGNRAPPSRSSFRAAISAAAGVTR